MVEGLDQPPSEPAQDVFRHQAPGVDFIDAGQKITGYAQEQSQTNQIIWMYRLSI
ncbi:MAG: hypothetical protein U0R17_06290 [Acidimicrobiia bacterium]